MKSDAVNLVSKQTQARLALRESETGYHIRGLFKFGVFDLAGALRFLYRGFSSLEADTAVGSVAEGLGHRSTATAERKRWFAGEVILVTFSVHQFDGTLGIFHAIWTILTYSNLDCHEASCLI
jgi:hypothetical protein